MRRLLSHLPFLDLPPLVNVVRLAGGIGTGGRVSAGMTDAALAPVIERAFRRGRPKAVALVVNSPGGSPVQSSLIAARIRRLAGERGLPVHAFVEDMAASGGYWLAAAADDIWVDATSIVGSIGVVSAGFGLAGLIERAGVERRLHTAGRSKTLLDPFLPERPEDVARLRALIEPMHAAFIAHVRARRGTRLADHPELFTGEVFVGPRAVELGLADGVAHLVPKLKELYGPKVVLSPYGQPRGWLSRLGAGLAAEALAAIEERAAFARHGR
ncbi:MAG: S49 family peptidase [Rhodobacteraceae bacterium]|jgi:serine protease SohB|nr:S49 family peptidase [Paracoccaceae bacterium]